MKLDPLYLAGTALFCGILLLAGCEHEDYTTWSCKNPEGNKSSMVLKKAQMRFKETTLNYCGSLGEKSYFDSKCPAETQNAQTAFITGSGILFNHDQEYRCESL